MSIKLSYIDEYADLDSGGQDGSCEVGHVDAEQVTHFLGSWGRNIGVTMKDVKGGCWMNWEGLSKWSETEEIMMVVVVYVCKCVYQCRRAWRPGQSDAPS